MEEANIPQNVLARTIGHADVTSFSFKTYSQGLSFELKRDALNKVGYGR